MKIVKEIEWAMGHRLPNHKSKCRNLHGHHYRLEICLQGSVGQQKGLSEEGMVVDFSDIKILATKEILELCDHTFMLSSEDQEMTAFFTQHPHLSHLIVTFMPTSENIARWIFEKLDQAYQKSFGSKVILDQVTLWETPTSRAIFNRTDL